MSARPSAAAFRRRRLTALLILLAFLALVVGAIEHPGGAGADAGGALVAEPVASATAANVEMLYGAAPGELRCRQGRDRPLHGRGWLGTDATAAGL
jgi:hypothetical protein